MCIKRVIRLIVVALFIHFSFALNAQVGLCPANLDFEAGNFTNWQCRTGKVTSSNSQNIINWTGTGQVNDRHMIINAANAIKDQYGDFFEAPPGGTGYSVKLGNANVFAEAESITYTYVIPANAVTFSVSYQYAVVLQNPNHAFYDQPRFRANVINVTDNQLISCVSFDFTASSSLPGFKVSTVDPSVLYKDWTPVTLDLAVYAGKTIQLEFITSDCILDAHFGYAYIDISSSCSGTFNGNIICAGDRNTKLTPPFGYQSYQWFADNSFSQVISTAQILTVDPLPATGTVYPLIVTPYPGFGCTDTLYATIDIAQRPVSIAGRDISICRNQPVQIGGTNNPRYTYAWMPTKPVSNPFISNPMAKNNSYSDQELILKTTDLITKCFSYDTIVISTIPVDTAIRFSGKNNFCAGEPANGLLSVAGGVNSVQWFNNKTPINGARTATYKPIATGNYWATVSQNGCTDSTATIPINVYASCNYVPTAFTPNGDGLNDVLVPFVVGIRTLKKFVIYNRWGNIIFSSTKNGEGWDGRYKGKLLDGGVYIWLLQVTDAAGKVETQKGTVTIIR